MPAAEPGTFVSGDGWTVAELAALLNAEVVGERGLRVHRIEPIRDAAATSLTFVRDEQHAAAWSESRAAAAIVTRSVVDALGGEAGDGRVLLVVDDADLAMIALLREVATRLPRQEPVEGVHARAEVDPSAVLGPGVAVAAGASIGAASTIGAGTSIGSGVHVGVGVEIGSGCTLHPNAVVMDRCRIGERVVIHAGAVIGADGFGYRPDPAGRGVVKIPHIGTVDIGDDVEIGASTCIDRGTFGATRVGDGTKIDNLVQIGHNVVVGRSCIICGQTGIAVSSRVGDGVTIGGSAGIRDYLRIGDGATIGAKSALMHDVPAGETWVGVPAQPGRQALQIVAATLALPAFVKEVRRFMRIAAREREGD